MAYQWHEQSKPNERTDAAVRSFDGHAGKRIKGSENARSHTRAGRRTAVGGGKTQERHH